jgi:hypothetical protein
MATGARSRRSIIAKLAFCTTAATYGFGALSFESSPGKCDRSDIGVAGLCTEEQAARGKARYLAASAACHGGLLQRNSGSPELAAAALMTRWGDQRVAAVRVCVRLERAQDRVAILPACARNDVRERLDVSDDGKWPNLGTRLGNSPPICRATGRNWL